MKDQVITIVSMIIEMASRAYGLTDDCEPFTEFNSRKVGLASAHFDVAANAIRFKLGMMDLDTIAHEIAHWVQFHRDGATQCYSTKPSAARYDAKLQGEHYRITQRIAQMIKLSGWNKEIETILG